MAFVIVTGVSGAGKSRAVNALEDIGFYCVDNMPPALIPKFAELCVNTQGKIRDIAIVTDVRGGALFNSLFDGLEELKKQGCEYKIMFIDADSSVIIRRFKETRRKHPLSEAGMSIEAALEQERILLRPARERADYIIDTTNLSPAQLKQRITVLFMGDTKTGLIVNCMSFGFKYGTPTEGDLIFDVRCFPNPFYIDELKKLTGLDEPVRKYVFASPKTQGFVLKLFDMIDYLLPLYAEEGKSQLVVGIGCTGGKHRSVAIAEALYKHLLEKGIRTAVNHRDIQKP
ncbi:MAG TPA: RNase adapter RapZ [Ruminiclostridium sp.]|nr:RNase adapter RapZ [Ruminiclostridium sp.]